MVVLSKPPAPTDLISAAALRDAFVHSGQATGSSDGLYDYTPAGDLRMPSHKYQCSQCGVNHHKSDVYVNRDDPSMDWQGPLNLVCRECWNATQEKKPRLAACKTGGSRASRNGISGTARTTMTS